LSHRKHGNYLFARRSYGSHRFLYPAEFFNFMSRRNGGNGGNFYSHTETQRAQSFIRTRI